MVKDSLNSTSLIFDHFKKIRSGLSIAFYLSAFIKDFNWGPVLTHVNEKRKHQMQWGRREGKGGISKECTKPVTRSVTDSEPNM